MFSVVLIPAGVMGVWPDDVKGVWFVRVVRVVGAGVVRAITFAVQVMGVWFAIVLWV